MPYFNNFERVLYKFGDEAQNSLIQNMSIYTDVIDQIRDDVSFYTKERIHEKERPDHISKRLYGSPNFYWTFYLMNDGLRSKGWPIDRDALLDKMKREYPFHVITVRQDITNTFLISQLVIGNSSGAQGIVRHRNLDTGQIIVELQNNVEFLPNEVARTTIASVTTTAQLYGAAPEYLAARYYVDGKGERTDFDPLIGPGALLTEKTLLDDVTEQNEELRNIRAIKREYLLQLQTSFTKAVSNV
tara:strand:+ start:1116 stop:1847 length:732 start_codon:yes stop_codon:yes gene_type:complete